MALTLALKHQLSDLPLLSQLGCDLTRAPGRNEVGKKQNEAEKRLLQMKKKPW